MNYLERSGLLKLLLSKKTVIVFLGFFLLSFLYRFSPTHHPFWVDEFSTAVQSRMFAEKGLSVFTDKSEYFEYHNIIPHFLVALTFQLIGESEFAARLPFMLIGSLVPPLVFLVGRKYFSTITGVGAALLSMTSYFLITWSRQARGYVLQETIVLLVLLAYSSFLEKIDQKRSIVMPGTMLCVLIGLGVLTHISMILLPFSLLLHFALFHRTLLLKLLMTWQVLLFALLLGVVGIYTGSVARIALHFKDGELFNNVGYYHSFLWREYGLVTFLGALGMVFGLLHSFKKTSLFFIYILLHLAFFSFLFGPYVSRYLLPIFPLFFLGMAHAISYAAQIIWKSELSRKVPMRVVQLVCVGIVLVVIANGFKFTLKPKAYYSVNHDFREIALINYDQVYTLIKMNVMLNEGKTAVVDTWPDRLAWYMGSDFSAQYVFRWDNGGIMRQTPYVLNAESEKRVAQREQVGLISNVDDLLKVVKKYPYGMIWIDDATLPADVIAYVQKNFRPELSLEHYEFDDNPYSIWPATLYSWGYAQ